GQDARFEAMDREKFVLSVFLPYALDMRAVVVGFNLPFDLSRLAVDFAPKRNVKATEAWTLRLLPNDHPAFAFTPGIRIQHVDARKSFISFTGTKGKRRSFRGAFVDLKTFTAALTGSGHSLKSAGEVLSCSRKKTEADYRGKVTAEYLDYCLNDVDLTAELYEKCLARYREFNLPEHPSRVFSSASLGKAAFRARGVVPPKIEDQRLEGRTMAAFYAGKVECRVVGKEVRDVAVLDFTSQYPSLFCLLGAERFLTAGRMEPRDTTEEVRQFLASLTAGDLLKYKTWANPIIWSLCEVEADGEILPVRSTYSAKGDAPTIGWNRVSTKEGGTLPYLLPDVIAAKL
ncbi:DNA-directed DNA polymerase B, partial [mine drainage metagenome]